MMTIIGCDISHYQDPMNFAKAYAMGVRFLWIKASEGINYKDPALSKNAYGAKAAGILVGAYHFMSGENGVTQYTWFTDYIAGIDWDLPPAMDCEKGVLRSTTTQAVVDVMGTRLATWMQSRPKMAAFGNTPVIYTSPGFSYDHFTTAMKKYSLWLADWSDPVDIPAAWAGEKIIARQDYVIKDATGWGAPKDLDHDYWGDKYPFPSADNSVDVSFSIVELGTAYSGRLPKV